MEYRLLNASKAVGHLSDSTYQTISGMPPATDKKRSFRPPSAGKE